MPLPSKLPEDFNKKANATAVLIGNRYSILKRIGSGNFGTAFLINDENENSSKKKLKVLKQICVGPVDPGETVDAMQEAKLLSQMKHKNIVQFHESFLDGQFFCIVLEYCEGGDLECKIRECKKLGQNVSEDQVILWLKQLLTAISYMHDRRILHRDLKTRNIFLKDNQVKIGDFGISRILIGTSDKASTFVGTPYYMSPEVLKHEQYDEKCDIWSLGCVLYEICCLEHAFEGSSLMDVMFKIVSDHIPHLPDTYSRALNNILEKMLHRDPHKRQKSKQILTHPLFGKNDSSVKENAPHLTARERLRMKKQKEADAKILRLKEVAKIKQAENARIRRESQEKNFMRSSLDPNMQIHESINGKGLDHLPVIEDDEELQGTVVFEPLEDTITPGRIGSGSSLVGTTGNSSLKSDLGSTDELIRSLISEGHIPEDGELAETFYSLNEDFESSSDEELPDDNVNISDSEYRNMVELMEDALYLDDSVISRQTNFQTSNRPNSRLENTSISNKEENHLSSSGDKRTFSKKTSLVKSQTIGVPAAKKVPDVARPTTSVPRNERPLSLFNSNIVGQRIENMRKRCIETLGEKLYHEAYEILQEFNFDNQSSNAKKLQELSKLVPDKNKCMELEQLIFLEHERDASSA